ncbi:hypothetical protein GW796_07965 [archaeon]|nr:hypothetical protein [archaeon]
MEEKQTLSNSTSSTTNGSLAHELVARDEQIIGVFFTAFAIQYFLHKDMLHNKITPPTFITLFSDVETYATQRMFIKNLISDKKYVKIIEEMQSLFLEFCSNTSKNPQPYLLFLSRINKAFLIRQVFNHSDQILEKYQFIDDFLNKDQIDMEKLNTKMWHFPVEQQILILARIYSTILDGYANKKKTILKSYKENLQRLIDEVNKNPTRYQVVQINNLKLFHRIIVEYETQIKGNE